MTKPCHTLRNLGPLRLESFSRVPPTRYFIGALELRGYACARSGHFPAEIRVVILPASFRRHKDSFDIAEFRSIYGFALEPIALHKID